MQATGRFGDGASGGPTFLSSDGALLYSAMPLGQPNPNKKWNALVVDDKAAIRLTLAILEMKGLSVLTAASADEACNRLRQQVFDLVVTDLKMESDTAGFAVAE